MWAYFPKVRGGLLLAAGLALAGCEGGFDLDLRDGLGGFDTTRAAQGAAAPRPEPDSRGVISYPNYQVVVAQRGDTVAAIAARLGIDADALARFNGIEVDAVLRAGEILALPTRVAEPTEGPVDIEAIASGAIERAEPDAARAPAPVDAAPLPQGPEPIRHRVARGETAFTIARLYGVTVQALAEWNGLGADLAVREGQFLLIPVAQSAAAAQGDDVTGPGAGTDTPTPPSSRTPVPDGDETPEAQAQATPAPEPTQAAPPDTAEFLTPVVGPVIRGYAKGRNEGVDFGAPAGTPVKAAEAGTVAAITRNTAGVPIIVIRHDGNLLTVYTQVDALKVEKDDRVRRGQEIAEVRAGNPSFLHFEVRNGLESVDPAIYLNL
ncbi:MAG: LysM peptidoglycan-binding domain-containing M23 family metallopeptidase [Pseudomonadota bacterium]